ncbi:MAG: hypothetical protein AAGU19_08020 [Prolixibacteraceae bacterium]
MITHEEYLKALNVVNTYLAQIKAVTAEAEKHNALLEAEQIRNILDKIGNSGSWGIPRRYLNPIRNIFTDAQLVKMVLSLTTDDDKQRLISALAKQRGSGTYSATIVTQYLINVISKTK